MAPDPCTLRLSDERDCHPRDSDAGDGDAPLIEAVVAGDAGALAALYDRHAPQVYALARRMLRSDADAEALVSDVFFEFWRKPDRLDQSRGALRTYLLVVARSRALDRLRARRKPAGAEASPLPDEPTLAAPGPGPAADASRDELARVVRAALAGLDAKQRTPLELAYFDGLTHKEIAERLGEPLGTVKTRIRAAVSALRHALRRHGGPDDDLR